MRRAYILAGIVGCLLGLIGAVVGVNLIVYWSLPAEAIADQPFYIW